MLRRREFLGAGAAVLVAGPAQASLRKSCILLNLVGGPSQLDTWDLKPNAPYSVRGPFRPIRTNVAGVEISEIFPLMAKHADKFTLIRSCYHNGASLHDVGHHYMQTGHAFDADSPRPHIGDAVSEHVMLPFPIAPSGGNVPPVNAGARLLRIADLDLHRETDPVRLRYGSNTFGQSCLAARRLVERGTRFVTVNMFESVFGEPSWDNHGSRPFSTFADYRDHVAPAFDRAYSALLEDLAARGLLQQTLVVGMGEFGRSPKINPAGGRDHWPGCFTIHVAGGGVRGGEVYGSSDSTGAEPRDNAVSPAVVAATVHYALGMTADRFSARPLTELFS